MIVRQDHEELEWQTGEEQELRSDNGSDSHFEDILCPSIPAL